MTSPADTKRKYKSHMDKAYTSHPHDISPKNSQQDTTQQLKKPYLKKRSGLFRFYKCLPSLLAQQEKAFAHSPSSRHKQTNNNLSYQVKSTSSNPLNSNSSSNASTAIANMLGQRSTTYNATFSDIKDLPRKVQLAGTKNNNKTTNAEVTSGVEIYEILDPNNGTEKYSTTSTIASRYSLNLDSAFEQGDIHQLPNFQSSPDIRETQSGSGEFLAGSLSVQLDLGNIVNKETSKPDKRDCLAARSFTSPRAPSNSLITSTNHHPPIHLSQKDFNTHEHLIKISSLHCGSGDEDEEGELANYDASTPTVDHDTDDNRSQTSDDQFHMHNNPSNLHSLILTSQIAELHDELMAMKNKVALLEKNAKEEGISTSAPSRNIQKNPSESIPIPHDDIPIRSFKLDKNRSNYQATIESIQSGLERIDAELADIQTGFVQKMESLEEEIHIKSQRWCENQIKMADKVHSLFSELEILSNSVKAQKHQVQNLAENVEKEFESMRSDWKDTQAEMEKRIKSLEETNTILVDKVAKNTFNSNNTCDSKDVNGNDIREAGNMEINQVTEKTSKTSNHNRCSPVPTAVTRSSGISVASVSERSVQALQHSNINSCPISFVLNKSEGSQVSPPSSYSSNIGAQTETNNGETLPKAASPPKIESVGGQIISARKTLPNGDVETVYTNGTRELIKSDKSEVRHMYRNGDVRTVAPDGTVTYFYAESSTWQTTYPTGVELFKFPNGVVERRLPNGLIEQTDIDGRVTFFQAAPPKPPSTVLPSIPSMPVLKPEMNRAIMMGTTQPNSNNMNVNHHQGRILTHTPGVKLGPGERIIVFENGEEEIHGPDYRKRIFADGTVKTVYQDGSQETRYPNGRIRIKDGDGNLVADVTVPPEKILKCTKLVRDCETSTRQDHQASTTDNKK